MLKTTLRTKRQRRLFRSILKFSLASSIGMLFIYSCFILSKEEHPILFIAGIILPFFLALVMPNYFGFKQPKKSKEVIKVKTRRK